MAVKNQECQLCGRLAAGGIKLQKGKIYTLIFFKRSDDKAINPVKKRMRLIKCYTHHALFESAMGVRTSFRYWDLGKLLKGEPR